MSLYHASNLPRGAVDSLIPQLADGNWGCGRRHFNGEQAGCSKSHAVNGKGSTVGPDLSNVIHRDYESILRDIVKPSYCESYQSADAPQERNRVDSGSGQAIRKGGDARRLRNGCAVAIEYSVVGW